MQANVADEPAANTQVETETRFADWKIIAILAFLAIAGTGSSATIYAATPMFVKVFADPKIIGWMSSIYFIVGAVGAGMCGGIGDLYGRRGTLIAVLAIVAVMGAVAGALTNPIHIVAAHAVQGLGVAAPTLNMGLIREHVSPRRVPMAIALVTTATTATVGLFFLLAGYIMDHASWRYTFYFGPFLLVPAVLLLVFCVPPSRPANRPRSIPVLNGLLFGLAALCLMIGIGRLGQEGFSQVPAAISGAGLVFLTGWIVNSLRTPSPMVDVTMLRQRGLAGVLVVYAILSFTMFHFGHVLLFVGKAAAQDGYGGGLTGTQIAAILAPQGLLALFIGPMTGGAVQRFGHYRVFAATLACICLPYVLLFALDHNAVSLLAVVLVAGVVGGAMGPAFRIALQAEVDEAQASSAMGLAELVRALCMGLGAQIVASALAHGSGDGTAVLAPFRFDLLIGGFIGAMLFAAAIYAVFGSRKGKI